MAPLAPIGLVPSKRYGYTCRPFFFCWRLESDRLPSEQRFPTMAPSINSGPPTPGVRSIRGAKNLKVARPLRLTLILMSLSGGQMVRCMSQNLNSVAPRFIQCC
jgi:hypothetical protein